MICPKCKTQQPRTAFRRKYKPYCWSCAQDYVNKFGAPPKIKKPPLLKRLVLLGYTFCQDCESLEPEVIMDANAFGRAIRKNCDSYREFLEYLIDSGFPDSHYVLCEECYHGRKEGKALPRNRIVNEGEPDFRSERKAKV